MGGGTILLLKFCIKRLTGMLGLVTPSVIKRHKPTPSSPTPANITPRLDRARRETTPRAGAVECRFIERVSPTTGGGKLPRSSSTPLPPLRSTPAPTGSFLPAPTGTAACAVSQFRIETNRRPKTTPTSARRNIPCTKPSVKGAPKMPAPVSGKSPNHTRRQRINASTSPSYQRRGGSWVELGGDPCGTLSGGQVCPRSPRRVFLPKESRR